MRAVVSFVAVLCWAMVANAGTYTLNPIDSSRGTIYGYNPFSTVYQLSGNHKIWFGKYDLSALPAGETVTQASVVYARAYVADDHPEWTPAFVSDLIPGNMTVAQQVLDPLTDTDYHLQPHKDLTGGDEENVQLQGKNFSLTTTETMNSRQVWSNPLDAYITIQDYQGDHSVDVTTMVLAWIGGEANYGLGMMHGNADPNTQGYWDPTMNSGAGGYRHYTGEMSLQYGFNEYGHWPQLVVQTAAVPEPASLGLLALGGLALLRRRNG